MLQNNYFWSAQLFKNSYKIFIKGQQLTSSLSSTNVKLFQFYSTFHSSKTHWIIIFLILFQVLTKSRTLFTFCSNFLYSSFYILSIIVILYAFIHFTSILNLLYKVHFLFHFKIMLVFQLCFSETIKNNLSRDYYECELFCNGSF